ncbi:hypothetical protein F3K40_20220 [Streptomyces sp. LBUM 1478]|nr:hypothetical protein [Streptomyces sp. LBUM 1484]MBP5869101.1 hypothetical protein [Streptomyces sp. LBUM 1485]MBP5877600.1 hypothetical protein [Streptomyces sp. LBUM 1477]MBP5885428.1 hypothetical protein [Streptomyces sp. LBUM 1487]MBP5901401.1 hypothetical protein [Streptomyces sp. LBUM 1488]MBP5907587.1 hypothetical protein [Streptomyces sp. LBUM 1478]MBP5914970.1 hypothetical protein [Streptomyces sp. LBUM 1486]MBP5921903.1 hypothetical protein [Streptomyces sp. LBUM 1483]QTU47820.
MEICIAVADWATGPVTSVLVVPGGAGTDARRRRPRRPVRSAARPPTGAPRPIAAAPRSGALRASGPRRAS